MTDPVAILQAKKAKILADARHAAEAVDVDLRKLQELRSLADKYGFDIVEKANGHMTDAEFKARAPSAHAISTKVAAYKAAISVAEQAIRAANHPLELSEIFDACESVGVKLGGARPQSTLSAYLSHSASTVESIRKGLYWLKDVPVPS